MTGLKKLCAVVTAASVITAPVLAAMPPEITARCDAPVLARLAKSMPSNLPAGSPGCGLDQKGFSAKRDALVKLMAKRIRELREDPRTDKKFREQALAAFRAHFARIESGLARHIRGKMCDDDVQSLLKIARAHPQYEDYILGLSDPREALVACARHDLRLMRSRVTREWQHYTREDFARVLEGHKQQIESLDYDAAEYDEFFEATYAIFIADNAYVWLFLPFALGFDLILVPVVAIFKLWHWTFEY